MSLISLLQNLSGYDMAKIPGQNLQWFQRKFKKYEVLKNHFWKLMTVNVKFWLTSHKIQYFYQYWTNRSEIFYGDSWIIIDQSSLMSFFKNISEILAQSIIKVEPKLFWNFGYLPKNLKISHKFLEYDKNKERFRKMNN